MIAYSWRGLFEKFFFNVVQKKSKQRGVGLYTIHRRYLDKPERGMLPRPLVRIGSIAIVSCD